MGFKNFVVSNKIHSLKKIINDEISGLSQVYLVLLISISIKILKY